MAAGLSPTGPLRSSHPVRTVPVRFLASSVPVPVNPVPLRTFPVPVRTTPVPLRLEGPARTSGEHSRPLQFHFGPLRSQSGPPPVRLGLVGPRPDQWGGMFQATPMLSTGQSSGSPYSPPATAAPSRPIVPEGASLEGVMGCFLAALRPPTFPSPLASLYLTCRWAFVRNWQAASEEFRDFTP